VSFLRLNEFRWIFSGVDKEAAKSPWMALPKPKGYRPPKIFDMDLDPNSRGYKLNTIRDWADGKHIKTKDGWLPYDQQKGMVQHQDGSWVKYSAPKESDAGPLAYLPKASVVKHAIDRVMDVRNRLGTGKFNSKVDVPFLREVYDEAYRLFSNLEANPLNKIAGMAANLKHNLDKMNPTAVKLGEVSKEELAKFAGALAESLSTDQFGDGLSEILSAIKRRELRNQGKVPKTPLPDSAALHKIYKDKETQKLSKPPESVSYLDHDSTNFVQVKKFEDGSKAIFKQDHIGFPLHELRKTLDPMVGEARREAAAYAIDKLFGLGVVPPTVLTSEKMRNEAFLKRAREQVGDLLSGQEWSDDTLDKYVGMIQPDYSYESSTQKFVPGLTMADLDLDYGHLDSKKLSDAHRIAVLDYILGNTDRHNGNVLLGEDGRVYAIDNGLSLPSPRLEQDEGMSDIGSKAAQHFINTPIDDDLLENIGNVEYDDFYKLLSGYGFTDEIPAAWERAQSLLQFGNIP
jgi:hypothetical protein